MLIIFFRIIFFHSEVIEWNKLDQNICNSENLNIFNKKLSKFILLSRRSVFRFHNLKGVKLLARLRFGQSHLWEHKFKHSFLDLLNQSVVMVKTLTCQFTSVSTVLILPMKG